MGLCQNLCSIQSLFVQVKFVQVKDGVCLLLVDCNECCMSCDLHVVGKNWCLLKFRGGKYILWNDLHYCKSYLLPIWILKWVRYYSVIAITSTPPSTHYVMHKLL